MPDRRSAPEPPLLEVGELVGLLADDDRRKVVAAMVLGASTTPEIAAAAGLDLRAVVRALNRLVNAGLVVTGHADEHVLLERAFALAARADAASRPRSEEHGDAPPDEARVLRAFVHDGRLTSIPSSWGKRRVVLEWLAQRFEPGRRYSEAMVNLSLGHVHPDTAALRRYLVDDGFLSRDHGEYWRTGGVDPDDPEKPSVSDTPLVTVEHAHPHVSVITLNKPERLNSMSFPLVEALYGAIAAVAADNETWVVVLTGAGRAFCSGLDLQDRGVPPNVQGLGFSRLAMRSMDYMGGVVPALRTLPQPVIAAINGAAIGGGLCMTLGADIRYASESAYFANAGITNGLTGSELGVSYLLPRAIGSTNAAEILLTGRRVEADEALRIGLVSRVVADGALLDTALATADAMCELSPFGIMMTKQSIWANLEIGSLQAAIDFENRNQLLAGYTGNLDEAIAAFREKRKPVYGE